MIEKHILTDTCLTATPDGMVMSIRLPWYRALPLSVISIDGLNFDGAPVDSAQISFELGGISLPLSSISSRTDLWWEVCEDARLHVRQVKSSPGQEHRIEFCATVRPPYIRGFVLPVCASKTVVAL